MSDIYALRISGTTRKAAFFSTSPYFGALAAVPILGEHWRFREYPAGWRWQERFGVFKADS
ncbi:MAG: hypothetical protein NPIRA03_17030 [Nitrospirales bacterium]|nr:MAG: hypothetical protein NPIRA03_17030 [Nitrospirales bacterium]